VTFGRGHGLWIPPGPLVSSTTITLVTLAAGPIGGRGSCRECLMCPGSLAFFGPSAVAVWCILDGPCWYLVCLVETSGDLAPSSDDDDAVVVRELAACLASRKLGSGRHHSPRNQAIEFARPRFKLLPAPFSCTSLKTTSPSASHPACFFCLPTYCNCILLFYTLASAPSTTSQSQNEDFNCSPRYRREPRLCPEHQ